MKYFILCCAILAILGCTTTFPVKSTKDPNFKGELESLYILVGTGRILIRETKESSAAWTGRTFLLAGYLADNLKKRLLENGIDAKATSSETEKSFSQAVMSIRLKHAFLQPDYYSLGSGVFDISIQQDDKTIWKSRITAGVEDTQQANRLIDTILSSMRKDGLIASLTPAE
jgi:hypothetical protein